MADRPCDDGKSPHALAVSDMRLIRPCDDGKRDFVEEGEIQ